MSWHFCFYQLQSLPDWLQVSVGQSCLKSVLMKPRIVRPPRQANLDGFLCKFRVVCAQSIVDDPCQEFWWWAAGLAGCFHQDRQPTRVVAPSEHVPGLAGDCCQ